MRIHRRFLTAFLILCLLPSAIQAQDTITFTWKGSVSYKQFMILATSGSQFTINWGNGSDSTYIGTGNYQTFYYVDADTNDYSVNIVGNGITYLFLSNTRLINLNASGHTTLKQLVCNNNPLISLDVSKCTALKRLDCTKGSLVSLNASGCTALDTLYCNDNQLSDLNVNGCTALSLLHCYNNKLNNLDLTGCTALRWLDCCNNLLSNLDLSTNTNIWNFVCWNNQIPLSNLYIISKTINTYFGKQTLPLRTITVGDTIDFSTETTFNGIATTFDIKMNNNTAVIGIDYSINNGIIVFNIAGNYKVTMINTTIQMEGVVSEFVVKDDASLTNLTISNAILTPAFNSNTLYYIVNVDYNVTSITITATPKDINATLSGDIGLQQLTVGANIFMVIVTAKDGVTKLNYTVTVNRATANTDATLSNLTVSDGTLTPAFNNGIFEYTTNVSNSINSIIINATANNLNAIISGNIGIQQLVSDTSVFTITVTAEDEITTKDYIVTVIRSNVGITMTNDEQLTIVSCEIFDIIGKLVYSSPNPSKGGKYSPSFGEGWGEVLPAGIYIIKIQTNKGTITKKLIKYK